MPVSYTFIVAPDVEQAARRLRRAFRRYKGPSLTLRFWDGSLWHSCDQPSTFTIEFRNKGAWERFASASDERAIAELYVSGEVGIDGNLYHAIRSYPAVQDALEGEVVHLRRFAHHCRSVIARTLQSLFLFDRSGPQPPASMGINVADAEAFFRPWLGQSMVFAVGFFRTMREDLEGAQEKGLEDICRRLQLRKGDRFLDLSCGWGSLLLHAVKEFGVSGHGMSQSEEQIAALELRIATAGKSSSCGVYKGSYLDLEEIKLPFDRIVGVAFPERVFVRDLGRYFERIYNITSEAGLFLCDFLVAGHQGSRDQPGDPTAIQFVDERVPTLHEVIQHAEQAGFSIASVDDFTDHYEETLRLWLRGLVSHPARSGTLESQTLRSWELCISCGAESAREGRTKYYRLLCRRPVGSRAVFKEATDTDRWEPDLLPSAHLRRSSDRRGFPTDE